MRRLRSAIVRCAVLLLGAAGALRAQDATRLAAVKRTADSLQAVVRANSAKSSALAGAYLKLAQASLTAGDDSLAVTAFDQSIALSTQAHDTVTLADAHSALGLLHWRRNRYELALTNLERARALRAAIGDREGVGRVLNSIGASYYQLGTYEPALDAFVQSLEIQRELRDTALTARVLTNIGKTYHDWRQYDRARRVLEEAVATARTVDSQAIVGYALNSLAMLSIDMGDYARARTLIDESTHAYLAKGRPIAKVDSLGAWSLNIAATALLLIREGQPAKAMPMLDSLLAGGRERKSVRGQARSLLYIGEAQRALGNRARARAAFEESLALSRSVNQRIYALEALRQLADLEEATGNAAMALRHERAYLALRDSVFDQATAQRIAAKEARAETQRAQADNARLREEQRIQALVIQRQRAVGALGVLILLLTVAFGVVVARLNRQLRGALSEVKALSGLIPICAHCKKVRDDRGYWEAVDVYISNHSDARFSHSICQSCGPKLYGELWPNEAAGAPDATKR
jgi:tetratricopeptide (TPR) repeat protein